MVAFPVATKLVVLFLLLIFNTSADDSDLIDPLLAQKAAIDFSPSLSDDAFASIRSQPITTNEASLQQLSDRLLEAPKPLLLTDSESDNCAGSQHTHKMPRRRSWRRLSERQQHDFCSVEDYQKPRVTRPSKTGAGNIPAGQLGKAGIGRPRATIGGPDEILPDPMLDLKDSQLYGKPNSALCPDVDRKVPVCTPYDQKLTSPAPILVPSRFWKPDDWCSDMDGAWEDMWCCAFAYVHQSIGWEMNVVFTRYPSTGIQCMLQRNHYTDN